MSPLSQSGKVLADGDSRRASRDRSEFATDTIGRCRLQIEALVLRQSARKKDVDARPGRAARSLLARGRRTKRREVIHAEAEQSQSPGLYSRATRDSRMEKVSRIGHPTALRHANHTIGVSILRLPLFTNRGPVVPATWAESKTRSSISPARRRAG